MRALLLKKWRIDIIIKKIFNEGLKCRKDIATCKMIIKEPFYLS
jgi:hypothetical protein